jgi:hypothetical protein
MLFARALSFCVSVQTQLVPSDVIIPTPSAIVASGDTLVSVTVTSPVLVTLKLCVIEPCWARSALKVSVIVGAVVGAVGVVVVPQDAANVRPTASINKEA